MHTPKGKPTPGPWTVSVASSPAHFDIYEVETEALIGEDTTPLRIAFLEDDGIADVAANARLIASAPKMLEAVEETRDELRRIHQQLSEGKGIDIWGLSGLPMLVGRLQFTIREAKGE